MLKHIAWGVGIGAATFAVAKREDYPSPERVTIAASQRTEYILDQGRLPPPTGAMGASGTTQAALSSYPQPTTIIVRDGGGMRRQAVANRARGELASAAQSAEAQFAELGIAHRSALERNQRTVPLLVSPTPLSTEVRWPAPRRMVDDGSTALKPPTLPVDSEDGAAPAATDDLPEEGQAAEDAPSENRESESEPSHQTRTDELRAPASEQSPNSLLDQSQQGTKKSPTIRPLIFEDDVITPTGTGQIQNNGPLNGNAPPMTFRQQLALEIELGDKNLTFQRTGGTNGKKEYYYSSHSLPSHYNFTLSGAPDSPLHVKYGGGSGWNLNAALSGPGIERGKDSFSTSWLDARVGADGPAVKYCDYTFNPDGSGRRWCVGFRSFGGSGGVSLSGSGPGWSINGGLVEVQGELSYLSAPQCTIDGVRRGEYVLSGTVGPGLGAGVSQNEMMIKPILGSIGVSRSSGQIPWSKIPGGHTPVEICPPANPLNPNPLVREPVPPQ